MPFVDAADALFSYELICPRQPRWKVDGNTLNFPSCVYFLAANVRTF
jgi:hypothetical protein